MLVVMVPRATNKGGKGKCFWGPVSRGAHTLDLFRPQPFLLAALMVPITSLESLFGIMLMEQAEVFIEKIIYS